MATGSRDKRRPEGLENPFSGACDDPHSLFPRRHPAHCDTLSSAAAACHAPGPRQTTPYRGAAVRTLLQTLQRVAPPWAERSSRTLQPFFFLSLDGWQSSGVNPPTNDVVGPSFISAQCPDSGNFGPRSRLRGGWIWSLAGREKLQGTCMYLHM